MPVRCCILRRAPTRWPSGPAIHWGLGVKDGLTGQWFVWHSTPGKGEHWDPLEIFAGGFVVVANEVVLAPALWLRLLRASNQPQAYDPLLRNCQHSVTEVVDGKPASPAVLQIGAILIAAVLVAFVMVLLLAHPMALSNAQEE